MIDSENTSFTMHLVNYFIIYLLLFVTLSCNDSHPDKKADVNKNANARQVDDTQAISDSLPADAVARVETYFQENLKARYMETNCQPTSYPGWEDFPLIKCRYKVTDKKDGKSKTAEVIMLNASPNQLARWVVYACLEVKGKADTQFTDILSKHIIKQSGAQFPIAGIVFEDLYDQDDSTWRADGVYEIYCFRNGVTVVIDGVKHMSTVQPTEEEIEKSLHGKVLESMRYARIQSTTREQYIENGGKIDVGSSSAGHRKLIWLEVTRDLYKAAWGNDRNELLIAWARKNL